MTAPFHNASNYYSLIIQSLDAKYCELLTASHDETQIEVTQKQTFCCHEFVGKNEADGPVQIELNWLRTGSSGRFL
jgi:hypothetical protein